jgi:hypothetical protein
LNREIQAIVKERNELKIKVERQFSISQARAKLSRHFEKVKSKNQDSKALVCVQTKHRAYLINSIGKG